MITLRHIEIYKKYRGDGDAFIRCATLEEKRLLDYKHWELIDDIIQNLHFIKKGLASTSFIRATNEKLNENCDNENTIQALTELS